MGAAPSGRPGWPEFAACTASMERTRRALMASVSSSRSSAGGATADKRTSSNDGVGLGNCHAYGGIIDWQGQTKPLFRQVSHVAEARLTRMELALSSHFVWPADRRWQRVKNDHRHQD